MYDMIAQFASQLALSEKLSLVAHLKSIIADELAGAPGAPEHCPHCGCREFVRRGKDGHGSQRWLCRGCGRSFTAKSKGILATSKLDADAWMEFAVCMADMLDLRTTAERIGVCLKTAWFMRHRVCEAMSAQLAGMRPGGRVQIDGTYYPESFSGNHAKGGFEPPRKRRSRGREGLKRGVSNDLVCVVTGVNDAGDVFCELSCRGREGIEDVKEALSGRVGAASLVETDMHKSYPRAMAALGVSSHAVLDPKDRSEGDLNMVNALHSRLDAFLHRFRSVATRRLQHYLDWFCWREEHRRSDGDAREIMYRQEAEGRYVTTMREYPLTPYPFREAISTVV